MARSGKDVSTGSFPTMGTSAATTVDNLSGQKSRNTKTVVRKGESKGGMLEGATAVHRPNIQERMGAQLHPSATLYAPNAASASDEQRNTRFVPSAIGNRDFWAKRAEGGRIDDVGSNPSWQAPNRPRG